MAITVDEAFEQIGSMGRYQVRLLAIFVFCAFSVVGFQTLLITFIAAEPGWRCADNSTACNLTGVHRPASKHYNFRCGLDRKDWEFTEEYTSAVTQWNLVCKDSILQSVSSSSIFAGWLLGAIILSWISDKTGRRKVAYFGALGVIAAALLSAASPNFWMFVVCRAIVGFFVGGTTLSQFVLVTEFVGVRHRNVAGTILWFAWTCSFMTTSLMAYFIRDWRILTIVISVTGIPFVFSWWFIPESVHWLLVKKRMTEAEEIIQKMAAFNKKSLPSDSLMAPSSSRRNSASFLDLFRGKRMTHFTFVFWVAWAINSMVYYGVSLSSQTLDGNMYLNFFLTSIIEIPANAAAIYCMKRFGRKKSTVIPMILASLASIGTVLLMSDPDDQGLAVGCIITAMIAKFFIMISFDSIYVYSAELFPTVIRSVGMGTSSAAGRIGSFLSSYVVWLKRIHTILPYGIMGGAALIAGLLCMSLPETKDQPTPEVIDSTSTAEELLERENKDKLDGTADQHGSVVKIRPECRELTLGVFIRTQWDLVCEYSSLGWATNSIMFTGWLFGNVIFGVLSDKYGRRKILFFSSCMVCWVAFASSFAPYYWLYAIFRFFIGFGLGGSIVCLFIMATEFVGPEKRAMAGTFTWYFWTGALMMIALLAYLIRDWRVLSITTSAPGILLFLFWFCIPESVRWLVTHDKAEDAEDILHKVGKFNRRESPQDEHLGLPEVHSTASVKKASLLDLFRTRNMTKRTIIIWISWFVNAQVYFGVSLGSVLLGGNMYLNFFLTSLIELPGNAFAIFAMGRFGRKLVVVVGLIVGAIGNMMVTVIPADPTNKGYAAGRIVFALVGKFAVMCSFDAIFVFTAELFPTVIRNIGLGSSSAAGRIGAITSPFVIWLARYLTQLPYIIMAVDALIAGVLCMLLPETNHAPTAETLESQDDADEKVVVDLKSGDEDDAKTGKDEGDKLLKKEKKDTVV